jgi:hypothetical protein
MFILRLLIAALLLSYIIWLFYNQVMGKNLGLSKVATWVLVATFLFYFILSGLSFVVEGF